MTQATPQEAPSSLEVVQQNTLSRTSVGLQPVAVQRNEALERFSQVIMYCVALVFIWGGIISLAFAEGASELNFLALLVGGGISSAMALFMIEVRARGSTYELDQPQGYLLGLSFFFMAIGMLWGTRFLAGWLSADPINVNIFAEGSASGPWAIDAQNWRAGPNTILLQTAGTLALMLGQRRMLARYSGSLDLAWAVMVFSPIALLWVGIGTWSQWGGDEFGWQLGLAMVVLCGASMHMSIQSDVSYTFVISAITTSLLPLVYQMNVATVIVDGSEELSAFSILLPLIFLQGWFAKDKRLRRELVEQISWAMVGIVVIVMLVLFPWDDGQTVYHLALFDVTVADLLGADAAKVLTPGVLLWAALLLGYFPAVHARRTPAMPILLAATLWTFSGSAADGPWIVAISTAAYMLGYADATRPWVAKATMAALAGSAVLRGTLVDGGVLSEARLLDELLPGLVPAALLLLAFLGKQRGLLPNLAPVAVIGLIVLTPTFANLLDESPLLSWVVALVPLTMWQVDLRKLESTSVGDLASMSYQGAIAMLVPTVLASSGRLSLGDGTETVVLVAVAALLYGLSLADRSRQVGLGGMITHFASDGNASEESAAYKAGSPLDQVGLVLSIVLLAQAASGLESDLLRLFFPVIPFLLLLGETLRMDKITSSDRAYGLVLVLLLVLWPIINGDAPAREDINDQIFMELWVWELSLLAVPVIVLLRKRKDFVYDSVDLDRITLVLLLVLAAMDLYIGLRMPLLFLIVAWLAHRHGRDGVLAMAPLIWIFNPMVANESFLFTRLTDAVVELGLPFNEMLGLNSIVGVLIIVSMFEPVRASITARRAGESNVGGAMATAWMLFGVVVLVPDVIWAGASVIGILILRQWWFGRPDAVLWLHAAMLAWLVLFLPSTMDSVTEALQVACLTVGLLAIAFSSGGRVFAYTPPLDEGNVVSKGEFDFTTAQGRKNITQSLELGGIVLLLCTPTFAYGIGHLIGAVMGTRQLLRRPSDAGVACLPVLHAMAAVVVLRAIFGDDVEITQVSGVVLAVESTVLLYIGLTQQDPISTWLQKIAPETVRSRDTMGVLGISYLVVSVLMIFANADTWTVRFLLIALICLSLGINGFGANGTSWQRAIGIYGGLVAMVGLSISIEGDNAGFWRPIIFLVIGMIAFGFGTLYLQRQGGPSGVLTQETTELKMVQGGITYGQAVPAEPLPTPVRSTDDLNAIGSEQVSSSE
ncbi:MAG TPA: hypothetical protein D7I05_06040, partial [Candidatus Poseidoniales archaeon]